MRDFRPPIEKIKQQVVKSKILFIPLFFVVTLLIIATFDIYLQRKINDTKLLPPPMLPKSYSQYPVLKDKSTPELSAKAAVIMDRDSGVVIFAKNENLRFSPASTTKIMTALTALNHFSPTDLLSVKEVMSEGSIIGLYEGEKMTFENLLYAMLLPSANDAAFVISQNYLGGTKAFVSKMNENANFFHLYNTHFSDPAGLIDEEDYTTAIDLARLASISLKNKLISEVVATKNKIIQDASGSNIYSILNLNKLLGVDGVNGIKTGFTDEAGGVLVTSRVENGHTLIIVVMKSEDRFSDTMKLLSLVSGINYLSIHP
ncbi:D-alanyl-D-alanine carboxypeptidase [Patescibacteria group bacterium]|nr:D-alanyl-D-alanine carboxypeptidase [Patescibacteria group bacterium]